MKFGNYFNFVSDKFTRYFGKWEINFPYFHSKPRLLPPQTKSEVPPNTKQNWERLSQKTKQNQELRREREEGKIENLVEKKRRKKKKERKSRRQRSLAVIRTSLIWELRRRDSDTRYGVYPLEITSSCTKVEIPRTLWLSYENFEPCWWWCVFRFGRSDVVCVWFNNENVWLWVSFRWNVEVMFRCVMIDEVYVWFSDQNYSI